MVKSGLPATNPAATERKLPWCQLCRISETQQDSRMLKVDFLLSNLLSDASVSPSLFAAESSTMLALLIVSGDLLLNA